MATTTPRLAKTLRSMSYSTKNPHECAKANPFVGSWEAPKDPKEAEKKFAQLRREYAKQVKEVRKEYIKEMELLRIEKQKKDEEKREALRVANEERKKLKAEEAKIRAQQRLIQDKEFRDMLMKERAEKFENWKMKEKIREKTKKENKDILRKQSSLWVEEDQLEKAILEVIVHKNFL